MSSTDTRYPQQNFQQHQAAPTEGLAIAALITGLLFWPAGLIISPMALSRIKRNHTGGRGMAIAGLILSIVGLVCSIVAAIFFFTVFQSALENAESLPAAAALGGFVL